MKKWKKILKCLAVVLLLLTVLVGVAFIWAYPYLKELHVMERQAYLYVRTSSKETFRNNQSSTAYDADGNVLFTYSGEKNMQYVSLKDIPQTLVDAFVVMEDRDFYEHKGVDYKAVIRAAIENFRADEIVQGASTITQQLARNIFLNQDVNYSRKIEEIFLAYHMEEKYSKDDIMEFYLNNIYFGNGFYGVGAAAKGYFGKEVCDLTMGECILLSAVPNNPSRYELFGKEEEAVTRAKRILRELYEMGKISELDYLLYASGEGNTFVTENELQTMESLSEMETTTAEGYVYTYVTNCVIRYLMHANGFEFRYDIPEGDELDQYEEEYDYWYNICQQRLYTGGYQIYTSIRQDAQNSLQKIMDKRLAELDLSDGTLLQGGAVCIDNETGLVIAAVGGRTEDSAGYGFNRAYQSYRQPGSAIKPLNVYTPYLCTGHSPQDVVQDVYDPQGPRNAGNAYAGEITLEEAVRDSKNTVAWQIYKELTPASCMTFLTRMEFKKVYVDRDVQAGALGGFTYGVSPEEMAGGFATLENDGVYRTPTCIQKLLTANGGEIAGYTEKTIYTSDAARIMTQMLQKVVEEGTGKRAKLAGFACAGKTGTTNSNKDAWFVGYTTYYTTSVWSGYDIPQELNLSNGNVSCDIWREFMEYMHSNLTPKEFAEPVSIPEPSGSIEETESETETSLEDWTEEQQELTLPSEEELTLPPEEELTLPPEEELTLPPEEELTIPVE
jgi:membrane peptidoglycan carboxypeptidase